MATRESSLTIAACFRRSSPLSTALRATFHGALSPAAPLGLSLSLSPASCPSRASFPVAISLSHVQVLPAHEPASFLSSIPVALFSLQSPLHSSLLLLFFLSSFHSTPKYCNFSLVATTALQLRNDKFLARSLPCLPLARPAAISSPLSQPHPLSFGNASLHPRVRTRILVPATLCFQRAVKLVRSIDSIDWIAVPL